MGGNDENPRDGAGSACPVLIPPVDGEALTSTRLLTAGSVDSPDPVAELQRRIFEEYAPAFSSDRGLSRYSFEKAPSIHPRAARAFLRAVDSGAVQSLPGAHFQLPRSGTKNGSKLFGHGKARVVPRRLTFSHETVIEVGAAGDLQHDYGWPLERLGFQSPHTSGAWAFDLCGYDATGLTVLAVEAKAKQAEIDVMVRRIMACGMQGVHEEGHCAHGERGRNPTNHHRKYQGLVDFRPSVFWALGPAGGRVFLVSFAQGGVVSLAESDVGILHFHFGESL